MRKPIVGYSIIETSRCALNWKLRVASLVNNFCTRKKLRKSLKVAKKGNSLVYNECLPLCVIEKCCNTAMVTFDIKMIRVLCKM